MRSFKSFYQRLFQVNDANFNEATLALFRLQAENNIIYKTYIENLGINLKWVDSIDKIPFMPISFFKKHMVKTGMWNEELIYSSSGTTGNATSRHYIKDNSFYLRNTITIFNRFYGALDHYHMLFLLPNYLERSGSSLVAMANEFIERSGSNFSGFYLNNLDELIDTIEELRKIDNNRRILLCGVSFALLDLAEKFGPNLHDVIVMETGGMKGRRKEIIRSEFHELMCSAFNIREVHSEYGMTELSSQAYSKGQGKFETPPWMKILLRDVNDPFNIGSGRSGGVNIIDLANVSSCAFIETQDLGAIDDNYELEILGRFDNSDIRGCNLMV